jgi:hypothetical protein
LKHNLGVEKMKKQLILIGIVVLILCIGFSGCTESINQSGSQLTDQEKIVGTWEFFTGSGNMLYFYSNGTYIKTYDKYNYSENGTYDFIDGKLIIQQYFYKNHSSEKIYDYSFSKNDNRLTLRQIGNIADEPYNRV